MLVMNSSADVVLIRQVVVPADGDGAIDRLALAPGDGQDRRVDVNSRRRYRLARRQQYRLARREHEERYEAYFVTAAARRRLGVE